MPDPRPGRWRFPGMEGGPFRVHPVSAIAEVVDNRSPWNSEIFHLEGAVFGGIFVTLGTADRARERPAGYEESGEPACEAVVKRDGAVRHLSRYWR